MDKQRVALLICPFDPFGPIHGGVIDVKSRIEMLIEQGFSIKIVAYTKSLEATKGSITVKSANVEIWRIPRSKLRWLLLPWQAFSSCTRFTLMGRQAVEFIIRVYEPTILIIEGSQMSKWIPFIQSRLSNITVLTRMHNIESSFFLEMARASNSFISWFANLVTAMAIRSDDYRAIKKSDGLLFISDSELHISQSNYPELRSKMHWVPVLVETLDNKLNAYENERDRPLVVFTGTMSMNSNIDAVVWFANQVWPLIISSFSEAKFLIIGRDPTKEVRELVNDALSIEVTGAVEDIGLYISRATLNVVPLRHGAGVKIKIVQALSQGLPTVSTSVGINGIGISPDSGIVLVADTANEFAEQCCNVLRSSDLRRSLSHKSKSFYDSRYSKDAVCSAFFLALNTAYEK
ncbi:MAG: glycosyltransferase [Acidibacillus sp.]|nr:glycosyltransferase [Acidibacillus sp.]